jgi:hypothetical protein
MPLAMLMAKVTRLNQLAQTFPVSARVKSHTKDTSLKHQKQLREVPTTKMRDVIAHLGRTVEMMACQIAPGSPPCARLDKWMPGDGGEARRNQQKQQQQQQPRPLTIREALVRTWYETIFPLLTDIPTDCYVLCGFNYTALLAEVCVWRTFDRWGIIGKVWDALMAARTALCHTLSPSGDGSDRYRGGGPATLLNKSTLELNLNVYTKAGVWLDNFVLFRNLKTLALQAVGSAIGVTPKSLSIEELTLTLMAAVQHRNATNITAVELQNWVLNVNLDSENGDVGLLYYITIFVPLSPDCPKISGDLRLFGVVPIYNPLWGTLPTWLPNMVWNITKYLAELEMIAPDDLIRNEGGCRALREMSLPFSNECGCVGMSYYNCGEKHGFSDPLDHILFILNWAAPSIAKSWWIRLPFKAMWLSDRLDQFTDVASKPNFGTYQFCFGFTSPGLAWAIIFGMVFVVTTVFVILVGLQLLAMGANICIAVVVAIFSWQVQLTTTAIANGNQMAKRRRAHRNDDDDDDDDEDDDTEGDSGGDDDDSGEDNNNHNNKDHEAAAAATSNNTAIPKPLGTPYDSGITHRHQPLLTSHLTPPYPYQQSHP